MKLMLRDIVWAIVVVALAVGLALCYIQLRECAQAAMVLRQEVDELRTKSHQLSEKNIKIVTNMTRLNRQMQESSKSASENANRTRETHTVDFFAARGLELMKLKRFKDAAAAFEIVFQNQPNNVVFIDRLIDCYENLGNERQARLAQVLNEFKNDP